MPKSLLRSVIQWEDPDPSLLMERWTEDGDEIKNASKLIVSPGQSCLLIIEGRVEGVYDQAGLFDLKTPNQPLLTTLASFSQGFISEHKVGLFFYRTTQQARQKFGTPSPVRYLDPVYKFPVGLRVFGNFSFRVNDIYRFVTEVAGVPDCYTIEEGRRLISSRMVDSLAETLAVCGYSFSEVDRHRSEIAAAVLERLAQDLGVLGLECTDFRIDGTSFDDETMARINRISDLQAEALGAQAVGLDFAGLKEAEATLDRARNPAQIVAMPGMMVQGSTTETGPDPAESLRKIKNLFEQGLITQEDYDAKRRDILERL